MKKKPEAACTWHSLSNTQQNVVSALTKDMQVGHKISGRNRIHFVSAARALIRKGLVFQHAPGHYELTEAGKQLAATQR